MSKGKNKINLDKVWGFILGMIVAFLLSLVNGHIDNVIEPTDAFVIEELSRFSGQCTLVIVVPKHNDVATIIELHGMVSASIGTSDMREATKNMRCSQPGDKIKVRKQSLLNGNDYAVIQ